VTRRTLKFDISPPLLPWKTVKLELRGHFPAIIYQDESYIPAFAEGRSSSVLVLQGLGFALDQEFESSGHDMRATYYGGDPVRSEYDFSMNAHDFVACVQAKVQKKELVASAPLVSRPATDCPELEAWLRLFETPSATWVSTAARSEFQRMEWQARKEASGQLFRQYMRSDFDFDRIEGCLMDHPHQNDFFQTLFAEFYDQSLAKLRESRSPGIQKLMNQIDRQYRLNHQRPLFRLTGHFSQGNPSDRFAGVHRGTGSIYMDLARIPRSEWYVIFIHEIVHHLDGLLIEASREFAITDGLRFELEGWAQQGRLSQLPMDVRADLDAWLTDGLNRGLWAEYRAWYITYRLYAQMVEEGLIQRIPRMDAVLALKPVEERLESFLLRYLEERSLMSTEGVFSSPMITQAISEILERQKASGSDLPLGDLQKLFD